MSDHPIELTKDDYETARRLWGESMGHIAGINAVLTFGVNIGADRELKACQEWVDQHCSYAESRMLMASRRPKPPSTKKKALKQLKELEQHGALDCNIDHIREALEELDG